MRTKLCYEEYGLEGIHGVGDQLRTFISGRPEALQSLEHAFGVESTDNNLVEAVRAFCSENTFFRGGQPHGGLAKAEVVDAVGAFCSNSLEELTSLVVAWSEGQNVATRRDAVRDVMRVLQKACGYFKGRGYWQKRFLEIILLSKTGGLTPMSSPWDDPRRNPPHPSSSSPPLQRGSREMQSWRAENLA